MTSDVTPIILAGGLGTRLRQLVSDRPKVLAPVAGRPFLERLFDQLSCFGFRNVVVCTGYMADQVEEFYGYSYGQLAITYSREITLLGTAGALRLAIDQISTSNVLVLNGDSYCEFRFESFLDFHVSNHAEISILLASQDDCSRFGSVVLDQSGRVVTFHEKSGTPAPGLINAGVYLLNRTLVREIRCGQNLSLEREIFPEAIGRNFFGCVADANTFIDIGTPQSFRQAQDVFSAEGLR